MVTALDLRLKRSRASCSHMCDCHQAVQFGTGQGTVMSCGWEGNRRSGAYHWPCVTDFGGSSTYVLRAKEWEMSTPPTLLVGYGTPSPFFLFRPISRITRPSFTNFYTPVIHGRGSVLRWRIRKLP